MSDAIKLGGGSRFQPNDYTINRYCALVPAGTTLEDVLHPGYFQNYLDQMRPMMEITVLAEDFSLDARLRVKTVTKTTAQMRILDVYEGERPKAAAHTFSLKDVDVNFGGAHKWRFIHAGTVIEHGFASKEDAEAAATAWVAKVNG